MFSNTLKWIEIWKLFEVWTKFSSYFIYQECGLTTIHNVTIFSRLNNHLGSCSPFIENSFQRDEINSHMVMSESVTELSLELRSDDTEPHIQE